MSLLEEVKLTRVPRWDERNHDYPLAAELQEVSLPISKTHRRYVWVNQGDTPACTGYSMTQALAFAPYHRVPAEEPVLNNFGFRLYRQAQQFDEWPGDTYEGSSVLGSAQALHHFGFLDRYEWVYDTEGVCRALLRWPVVIGINWYSNMFYPDDHGIIKVSGDIAGGHAICVGAYKGWGEWFRLDNSWGRWWGKNGSAWIHRDDLAPLIDRSNNGEAMAPVRTEPLPDLGLLPAVA